MPRSETRLAGGDGAIASAEPLDDVDLPPEWAGRLTAPTEPDGRADAHRVRMRDGVRLATDVHLPSPLRGRIPAVLIRQCHDKGGLGALARRVTERGFGIVVQDVRGTFRSGGERTPWFHEADDGFDTIDWVVRQSWCDERVAMLGDGYAGFAQWAAAAAAHPGLRAIAPAAASQRVPHLWFGSDVAVPDGVDWLARWWSGPGELAGEILDWSVRPLLDVIPEELENARRLHRELLSLNEAELLAACHPTGPPAKRLGVPALLAGAWRDVMTPELLRDWSVASSASPAAGHQHLVLAADSGEADLEFLDHHVRGRGDAPPRVRYEVVGAGWREADRWPPPEAQELRLHLRSGGVLRAQPGRLGTVRWVHDPGAPVPATVDDDRDDVVAFTATPTDRDLDIVGPIAADVRVASTAPSMHLVAVLADLAPDGRAQPIAEGIARIDTRYGPATATVHLGSTAYRLPAGHRLRLALASSMHPRYLVHPGTDDNPWTAIEARPSTQTLLSGALRLATA